MKKRILVVDDDADVAEPLGLLLSQQYDVDLAANGAEAVTRLEHARYDVVLLDLMMPVMDGSAFKAYVDSHHIHVPILLMSGSAELVERAAALGVDDHLPKPLDVRVLKERVALLLSAAQDGSR